MVWRGACVCVCVCVCVYVRMWRVCVSLQKSTKLKKMLLSPELEFIMEAHNGISARIAEEAGM